MGKAALNEGHGFSRAVNSRCLTASAAEVRFSRPPGQPGDDDNQVTDNQVTSMIGNSQGEAEIPPDLAEGVLSTGKAFA